MNIEDVKQLSDRELDVELSILTGFTARMAERLAIYGRDVEKYKNDIFYSYTANLANSREAQAKAIADNDELYVSNAMKVMGLIDHYTSDCGIDSWAVSRLLQASSRQISEAAYIR